MARNCNGVQFVPRGTRVLQKKVCIKTTPSVYIPQFSSKIGTTNNFNLNRETEIFFKNNLKTNLDFSFHFKKKLSSFFRTQSEEDLGGFCPDTSNLVFNLSPLTLNTNYERRYLTACILIIQPNDLFLRPFF